MYVEQPCSDMLSILVPLAFFFSCSYVLICYIQKLFHFKLQLQTVSYVFCLFTIRSRL